MAKDMANKMANNPNMTTEEAVNQTMEKHGDELGDILGPEYTTPQARQQMAEHVVNTIGKSNPVPPIGEQFELGPGGLREVSQDGKPGKYLGEDELALLDQMEANEIEKFTNQVMERSAEINQTAIADLVNRGVLQGTIGENVLARLNDDTLEIIGKGTTDIQTQRMGSELRLIQQGKELDWDKTKFTEGLEWDKSRFAEGLEWEKQRWAENVDLSKYLSEQGYDFQKDIADESNKWNTFGNVMSSTLPVLFGSGGTDWSKYFGD
jgi:hypothetical protein